MVGPFPEGDWAQRQVTYQHLIRPVVAFIRDHGPVPVERVFEFISASAAGDLRQASPTRDRAEAARLAFNLLVDDLDVINVAGDHASVPPDCTTVTSVMFGPREIPPRDELDAARDASRQARTLREWVGRNLFATKWRNGIRERTATEIDWMVSQFETFGYIGPKIVVDADLGTIINGGLRALALDKLGWPRDPHVETMRFANDLHRLAYVLAAHAEPGKLRVPQSLRNAILTEILPRGAGLLRDSHNKVREPTLDEWLAITGANFDADPEPVVIEPEPDPEPEPDEPVVVVPVSAPVVEVVRRSPQAISDEAMADRILAVMDPDEWVEYNEVYRRLFEMGTTVSRIDRTMRDMARKNRLERRRHDEAGPVQYRPRLMQVPELQPVTEGRTVLPSDPRSAKDGAMHLLWVEAMKNPGQWIRAAVLDNKVTELLERNRLQRGAYLLGDRERGTRLWSIGGEPWRVETRDEDNATWLRAVKD